MPTIIIYSNYNYSEARPDMHKIFNYHSLIQSDTRASVEVWIYTQWEFPILFNAIVHVYAILDRLKNIFYTCIVNLQTKVHVFIWYNCMAKLRMKPDVYSATAK